MHGHALSAEISALIVEIAIQFVKVLASRNEFVAGLDGPGAGREPAPSSRPGG